MHLNSKKAVIVVAGPRGDGRGMFPLKPELMGSTGGRLAIGISIARWTTITFDQSSEPWQSSAFRSIGSIPGTMSLLLMLIETDFERLKAP